MMVQMKILIIGAGIGGNAAAFWLSKLGYDVTVVERFPSLRATGLQIDLRGYGIEVMKRMGLEQAFRSKMAPEQGLQFVDKSGRRRAYFPANKSGKGEQNFTSEFEIMRGDLCNIMYDATKDRVKYIFGTSIESFEEEDGSVEVRFTDGNIGRFDLLIGADGQGSRTRKMILGSGTPDALYPIGGGEYIAYFTIPRPIQQGEEYIATMYMAPGRRGVMTRRHNPKEIQVYLGCKSDTGRLKSVQRGNVKEEKDALLEIFQGAGWQMDDILKSLNDAHDFYGERLALVKLESWSKGCAVLLGDAAYCPTANTGMGTTSAVVGAYILAGEISKHCGRFDSENADGGNNNKDGLATALRAYEQKFRPFMDQVQKGVSESSSSVDKYLATSFGIAVLNCFLGLASFLKLNFGKWMLKENVKNWDLPEYKEMLRD